MELSLRLVSFLCVILKLLLLEIVVAKSFTSIQPSCHDDERSALLQFKESFVIVNKSASQCDPKVLQWNSYGVNTSNCCLWDGVQCHEVTGHVIGLDLNNSCLFGSINSNSTFFNLVHLQRLNLAGTLLSLTYLNLSGSAFSGQIPIEISHLFKLSQLDLSSNYNGDVEQKVLELKNPNLNSLLQNLTSLEVLDLSFVNISSIVPRFLSNFTSLTSLSLTSSGLHGEFPASIFQLPNLRILDVGSNKNLNGYLPEFHHKSPLKELILCESSFSGSLPSSIQMLDSLDLFDVFYCNFSGPIPPSLGKLTQLTTIHLGHNNFSGYLPSSLQNLTQLTSLYLFNNHITGPVPPWLGNFTKLNILQLAQNQFYGVVPKSLSNLMNLEALYLDTNKLSGTLKFDMFLNMKVLTKLALSENNLSVLFEKGNINETTSKFIGLGLALCNVGEFPDFLRHQNRVEWLSLSNNKISGEIPKWMWNTSINTLAILTIDNNFLTGSQPAIIPWVNMQMYIVSFNMLQGVLPIPPPSILIYNASNNMLSEEISPVFCNLSYLYFLDLSDNTLSGTIPKCLANLSYSLDVLSLRNNFFQGTIPEICSNNASNLRIIDLSYNKLQGLLPRSLSNCMMLEGIVVSNNNLKDVFPSWLGSLPVLKILTLQQNEFYGVIGKPKNYLEFPKLRVIDISFNYFTGELPSHYIFCWNAMKDTNPHPLTYLSVMLNYSVSKLDWVQLDTRYAITITTKSVKRYYGAIQDIFTFIDMSSNRFEGQISELFRNLKGLYSLNLSNNLLTGCIPSSLGNLTVLESLDLSRNKLSGEIPKQLKQLGFLERFDVSHNNLTGCIPQGNQFNAFESSSFEGNLGLCGDLLFKKCGDSEAPSLPPSAFEENDDSNSFLEFDWKVVLIGFISGVVAGIALSDIVIIRRLVAVFLKDEPCCSSRIRFVINKSDSISILPDYERSALLQFKESLVIVNKSASLCNPKVLQWNSYGVNTSNCCLWDGVQCDEVTGHVIGLDLSSSCLFGSINSNNTLFDLVHLQRLNLAAIFQLPNLRILDVGSNKNLNGYLPEFHQKSPLKELILYESGFSGSLPSSIEMLDSLDLLDVFYSNFSGPIPSSLGKLTQLATIHLGHNSFSGYLPSSLQNLTQLTSLYLFNNHITGPIPPWLGNLTKLNILQLAHNQFYGLVPQSLSNLMNL
nr:receptor-like protein 7 [Ziziphus jujuba var. spinosa]